MKRMVGWGQKAKKEILFERTGFVIYSTFGTLLTHSQASSNARSDFNSEVLLNSIHRIFNQPYIFGGFHNQSAPFADKEARSRRISSKCSKLLGKKSWKNQEEEATVSCEQWLLLKRLAWMLLQWQFNQNRRRFHFKRKTNFFGLVLARVLSNTTTASHRGVTGKNKSD